ncbi:MAG: hypothetical protein K2J20_01335 [Bacilli bacterium]|nr:hypothetical protein [Bacilli bacterium]
MYIKKIVDMSEVSYYPNRRKDFSETAGYLACHYSRYRILDKDNAIVEEIGTDKACRMAHLRIVDGWLTEINSWDLPSNSKHGHQIYPIKDLGICLIGDFLGNCYAIYDFKNAEFTVTPGVWDDINDYDIHIKGHNGFLARFTLCSYATEGELLECPDFLRHQANFPLNSDVERYFAALNYNGTIRADKLFRGDNMDCVTEIIDLAEYGSVEEFKARRLQALEEQKQERIRQYKEFLANRNDVNMSLYLDSEILSVMGQIGVGTIMK